MKFLSHWVLKSLKPNGFFVSQEFENKAFYILATQCTRYVRVGVNLRINDNYFPIYKLTDLMKAFHFDEASTTEPQHRSKTYYTYQSTDHVNFVKIYPTDQTLKLLQ